jgi:hypothetical protein
MQVTINDYTIFLWPPLAPLRHESLPVAEDAFAAKPQIKDIYLAPLNSRHLFIATWTEKQ